MQEKHHLTKLMPYTLNTVDLVLYCTSGVLYMYIWCTVHMMCCNMVYSKYYCITCITVWFTYTGADPCLYYDCHNGGECYEGVCLCPEGFGGLTCEKDLSCK